MTYFAPLVPDAAPLAVRAREDAVAQLPEHMKQAELRPVTDALLDALVAIVLEGQYRGSYAAAQSHVARAVERFLVELAGDRGVFASEGEGDDALRARVAQVQQVATLAAIRAAVNAILAPHTSRKCQVIEPALDRWFVRSSSAAMVWFGGCVGDGISPPHGDRLYPSEASRNEGVSIESSEPLGARSYSDRTGRLFHVLVPDLTTLSEVGAFAWGPPRPLVGPVADPRTTGPTTFAGGTAAQVGFFVRSSGATANAVMHAIEDAVNGLAGHSMRWLLLSDTHL